MYGLTGTARIKHALWLFSAPVVCAIAAFFGWYFYQLQRYGVPEEAYSQSAAGILCMTMGAVGLLIGTVIGMIGAWRVQSKEIVRKRLS